MSIDSVNMLTESEGSGFAPSAIPKATSSQTGVSVEYAPDATKKWFVFRASYGRQDLAADLLIDVNVYAYVVKRYQWKIVDGKPRKVLESLIPNMVFAYLTPSQADLLVKDRHPEGIMNPSPRLQYLISYYYDHFREGEGGKNPPIEVPNSQMINFILGTCSHDENLVVLQKESYHFKSDDLVEVIGGPFKGVRGRVIRSGGQQRVLLQLTASGTHNVLGEYGTAFIPSSLMRKLDPPTA